MRQRNVANEITLVPGNFTEKLPKFELVSCIYFANTILRLIVNACPSSMLLHVENECTVVLNYTNEMCTNMLYTGTEAYTLVTPNEMYTNMLYTGTEACTLSST